MGKNKKNCIHHLEYQKWLHFSRVTDEVHSFHYKQVCVKCGWSHYVQRTQYLYNLLKDKPWYSKKQRVIPTGRTLF